MARKDLCVLQREGAIEAIKGTDTVHYKHGVWNPYKIVSTEYAIKAIDESGYGADVSIEEETGELYVAVPCDSDMW